MPYCEAHIPKAKATTVADTPEMKRIQENTKIQSNAAYHAEFEKSKGKFTAVVDDPELLRLKGNTKIISNVAYHGDIDKKAIMESKRNLTGEGGQQGDSGRADDTNGTSPTSYMDEISSLPVSQPHPAIPPQQRYAMPPPQNPNQRPANNYYSGSGDAPAPTPAVHNHGPTMTTSPQHQQVMMNTKQGGNANSPYSSRGAPTVVYSSDGGSLNMNPSRKVGSIADYDPVNNYFGSLDPQRTTNSNSSGQHQVSGRVGGGVGGGTRSYNTNNVPNSVGSGGGGGMTQPHHPGGRMMIPPPESANPSLGVCYRALYDYEAQDNDEISFSDGDLLTNCSAVDEGWMTGTVQRSGRRGMLPANYVTPVTQN